MLMAVVLWIFLVKYVKGVVEKKKKKNFERWVFQFVFDLQRVNLTMCLRRKPTHKIDRVLQQT